MSKLNGTYELSLSLWIQIVSVPGNMGWLVLSCSLFVAYWVLLAIYRLHFHPLSRYRGPRVAAVSKSWYEWYWNYYLNGQMIFEIQRLHKQYGKLEACLETAHC
jgi:hypothetical protein